MSTDHVKQTSTTLYFFNNADKNIGLINYNFRGNIFADRSKYHTIKQYMFSK